MTILFFSNSCFTMTILIQSFSYDQAYASILYLRRFTDFKIILRGKPVQQYDIKDDLKYVDIVPYKPQLAILKEVSYLSFFPATFLSYGSFVVLK